MVKDLGIYRYIFKHPVQKWISPWPWTGMVGFSCSGPGFSTNIIPSILPDIKKGWALADLLDSRIQGLGLGKSPMRIKGLLDETLGNLNWMIYGSRRFSEACAVKLCLCKAEARGFGTMGSIRFEWPPGRLQAFDAIWMIWRGVLANRGGWFWRTCQSEIPGRWYLTTSGHSHAVRCSARLSDDGNNIMRATWQCTIPWARKATRVLRLRSFRGSDTWQCGCPGLPMKSSPECRGAFQDRSVRLAKSTIVGWIDQSVSAGLGGSSRCDPRILIIMVMRRNSWKKQELKSSAFWLEVIDIVLNPVPNGSTRARKQRFEGNLRVRSANPGTG
jgi:hypothetical protein